MLLAGAGIFQRHQQSRPVVKIGGDFGESVALGIGSGNDIVADSPDLAVVIGEKGGFDFLVFGGAAVLIGAD